MKGSIETFVAVILIVIAALFSVCYITVAINHNSAQKFHSSVISEIEDSDFSEVVINEQIARAESLGFYMRDEAGALTSAVALSIDAPSEEVNTKISKTAKVELTYYYDPVFIKPIKYTLTGYAR